MADKTPGPLTFGFDIGIASVGWCVLGENHIVALGVRCFDKAETAKEGESLNLARRTARLMRRRLRRRAWRLTKLARLLKREGLIDDTELVRCPAPTSPWRLRVEGLDRKLNTEEWARVIYHLCKHRGFHWISRAEEKKAEGDAKSEGGRVKRGLSDTKRRMEEKGYRSAAEMILTEFPPPSAQRNKQGDYGKALSRALLADELKLLFLKQREFGNVHAGADLEARILDRKSGLLWAQKPPLAGGDLLKMLGKCTFEKDEFRAPKASFTAERHVWLTRLNNLRIVVDGVTRPLNDDERRVALPMPYEQASDLTYKQLHAALVKKGLLPETFEFTGLRAEKDKDPKAEKLIRLPAWQELRKKLKEYGLETEWQSMAGAATGGDPTLLDEIARVLSVFKDGDEVIGELRRLTLPGGEKMVDALSELSFDKFHALSLKTLRKIVPHMEAGMRYDEACAAAGYHHSQLHKAGDGQDKYLPPLYSSRDKDGRMIFRDDIDVPRNPVVLRSLNQARKVMNALIRQYGSPSAVHIEMARDLSRPLDERREIEKEQKSYQERNEKDRSLFIEQFGCPPKKDEFEKFRLYREQQGKSIYPTMNERQGICAYSLTPIDLNRLLEPGYVEIDHALPYSRSFDDSKNNKVLALTEENRNKGNRTPYEYLDGANNSPRWREFMAFVESNKAYRLAKRSRLLRKDFAGKAAEEFRERNLNDTRYICRFFKNYIEQSLKLADGSEAKRCVVLSGQMTAFLRARWGLLKVRSDSDRHHALDAAVVAACSHGMVKRLGDYSRTKELAKVHQGFVDPETGEIPDPAMYQQLHAHFPDPWPRFRDELTARLGLDEEVKDDREKLRMRMQSLGTYPPEALDALRPVFVSRAPQRRGSGPIHEETIRSTKHVPQNTSHVSVPLHKLKLSRLTDIVGATYSRNAPLIALLRHRLEMHGDDGKKAFAEPVFKPSKTGKGSLVKSVKLASTQNSGIRIRGGVAEFGEMHHVEVFRAGARYHLEPSYQARADSRINPPNIPDKAEFLFSLNKNDYVEVTYGNTKFAGYFVMYESDGRVTLRAHDQPKPDKEYFRRSVATATLVRKFHIDTLGNIYPAPPETRRGLA